ncbi:protein eyes shut-like isoform X2 [Littorina saxatilis]|uniref:protein eyes shut-like isoform X2 n=1 Tax=Littorina saxatilis TaxID=31220 RepID=UPI0038B46A20
MVAVCLVVLVLGVTSLAQAQQCTYTDETNLAGEQRLANTVPGVTVNLMDCKAKCDQTPGCVALDFGLPQCNLFFTIPLTSAFSMRIFSVRTCLTVDPCEPDPCQNGGSCQSQGEISTCSCPPLYTGNVCETAVDPCEPDPCQNGGSCQSQGEISICSCPPLYTGNVCETAVDPCEPDPCQNGGSCQSQGEISTCSCPPLYTGNVCETAVPQTPCATCPLHRFCAPEASCTQQGCACPTGSRGDPYLLCVPENQAFCELFGDPHLKTFGGEHGPVSIPCVYRVASFFSRDTSVPNTDTYCKVVVSAANSPEPVRGQYYVTAVKVTVSKVTGPDPSNPTSESDSTVYTTSSDSITNVRANSTASAWTVNGTPQLPVEPTYQPLTNTAKLTIPSCDVTVAFKAFNTTQTVQTRLPGLAVATPSNTTVWVDADFPNTLCSSPQGADPLGQRQTEWSQSAQHVAVYGVLVQQLTNPDTIPGYNSTGCEAAVAQFGSCAQGKKNSAVQTCAPLVAKSSLANCLPSPVIKVLANCLKYQCSQDNAACGELKAAAAICPELTTFVPLNC